MKKIILIAAIALVQTSALAGKDGNGGGAVVCRELSTGRIVSAELLDLWEAANINHIPIVHSNESYGPQINRALERYSRLNPTASAQVALVLNRIVFVHKFEDSTIAIQPPTDAHNHRVQKVRLPQKFRPLVT